MEPTPRQLEIYATDAGAEPFEDWMAALGPGYRVYYGLDGKVIVLLLSGGDKASQEKDIKKAKKYWQDYQRKG